MYVCKLLCYAAILLQVDSAWSSGNYTEAQRNASIARILNYVGIGIGIAGWVFVAVIVIINVAVAASIPR